jgi:hypothetical protein
MYHLLNIVLHDQHEQVTGDIGDRITTQNGCPTLKVGSVGQGFFFFH